MGSILIIKNNYEVDPELLKLLKQSYKVHLAEDAWHGQDILSENYIDVSIIASDDHIEKSTWDFINELHRDRLETTPIIFISKKLNEQLSTELLERGGWFFLSYPIDKEKFLAILKNQAMAMAQVYNTKGIILKKSRESYHYKIKDISRIERTTSKSIAVYTFNSHTLEETKKEFRYEFSLVGFLKLHNIENFFTQASQSCLVNTAEVEVVKGSTMELVLRCGASVPVSRNYIKNFRK